MKGAFKGHVAAAVAGLLFAFGLGLGGMTDPSKVLGFLDFTRAWDPSLAFVMGGALLVHAPLRAWISRRRARPAFAEAFVPDPERRIDLKLIAGAALFGAGWGLAGLCPGPALADLASGVPGAFVFIGGMLGGTFLVQQLERGREAAPSKPAVGAPVLAADETCG